MKIEIIESVTGKNAKSCLLCKHHKLVNSLNCDEKYTFSSASCPAVTTNIQTMEDNGAYHPSSKKGENPNFSFIPPNQNQKQWNLTINQSKVLPPPPTHSINQQNNKQTTARIIHILKKTRNLANNQCLPPRNHRIHFRLRPITNASYYPSKTIIGRLSNYL